MLSSIVEFDCRGIYRFPALAVALTAGMVVMAGFTARAASAAHALQLTYNVEARITPSALQMTVKVKRVNATQALILHLPSGAASLARLASDGERTLRHERAAPASTAKASGQATKATANTLKFGAGESGATVRYELAWAGFGVEHLGTHSWLPYPASGRLRDADAPHIGGAGASLELTVEMPEHWHAVAQGRRTERQDNSATRIRRVTWREPRPLASLDFVAGPYLLSRSKNQDFEAEVLLRSPAPALAKRYLAATHRYVTQYSRLLGAYPHQRFTLVENDRPTGWGMATFTLLGNRVIRLPFIIHTSYPHEIVHSWWGNGVYAGGDGNWTEGLTTYLADHALRESKGEGVTFRRDALARFRAHEATGAAFPLHQFRARHSRAAQAVGYDKSMMLFHMVRRRLGDQRFVKALQTVAASRQFTAVGFDELLAALGGESTRKAFAPWLNAVGVPTVTLVAAAQRSSNRVQVSVRQSGSDGTLELDVPIAVLDNKGSYTLSRHRMTTKTATFEVPVNGHAKGVVLDPHIDLLRRINADEVAPRIGDAFARPTMRFAYRASGTKPSPAAWQVLAGHWMRDKMRDNRPSPPAVRPSTDSSATKSTTPDTTAVVWLGTPPPWAAAALDALKTAKVTRAPHQALAMAWRTASGDTELWLSTVDAALIERMARALPHYGKRSYVLFDPGLPRAAAAGQWPVAPASNRIALDNSAPSTWPPIPEPAPLLTDRTPGLAPIIQSN